MSFISGKNAKLLIKQWDLSEFFQEVVAGAAADELDVTTFGSIYRKFIGGLAEGTMTLTGFFDTGTGSSDVVLFEALDDTEAFAQTFFPEGHGTINKPAFVLKAVENRYETGASTGAAVPAAAAMAGSGGARWGRVLSTGAAVTPTATPANFTGIDNPQDAATSKGASAHLHVLANTYDQSTTIKVQHSADDVTYADLMTFTAVAASTLTSERKEVALGTNINRYLRAQYVGAAGTGDLEFVVAVSRGF